MRYFRWVDERAYTPNFEVGGVYREDECDGYRVEWDMRMWALRCPDHIEEVDEEAYNAWVNRGESVNVLRRSVVYCGVTVKAVGAMGWSFEYGGLNYAGDGLYWCMDRIDGLLVCEFDKAEHKSRSERVRELKGQIVAVVGRDFVRTGALGLDYSMFTCGDVAFSCDDVDACDVFVIKVDGMSEMLKADLASYDVMMRGRDDMYADYLDVKEDCVEAWGVLKGLLL